MSTSLCDRPAANHRATPGGNPPPLEDMGPDRVPLWASTSRGPDGIAIDLLRPTREQLRAADLCSEFTPESDTHRVFGTFPNSGKRFRVVDLNYELLWSHWEPAHLLDQPPATEGDGDANQQHDEYLTRAEAMAEVARRNAGDAPRKPRPPQGGESANSSHQQPDSGAAADPQGVKWVAWSCAVEVGNPLPYATPAINRMAGELGCQEAHVYYPLRLATPTAEEIEQHGFIEKAPAVA